MSKLRLGPILDEKPIKLSIEIPAALHRSLKLYAAAIAKESGGTAMEPSKLVAPMLDRFIQGDKAFRRMQNPRASKKFPVSGKFSPLPVQD
jgi:hypothetical protein